MSASSMSARSHRYRSEELPEQRLSRSENSSTHDSDSQISSVTSRSSSPEAQFSSPPKESTAVSSQTPLAPPAPPVLPLAYSRRGFCTPWFQDQRTVRDACSECADSECQSSAPGQQLADRPRRDPQERRRVLRRGVLAKEIGEHIIPDKKYDSAVRAMQLSKEEYKIII